MAKRSIRKNSFKGGRTKKKKDKKKNSFKNKRKVKFAMGISKKRYLQSFYHYTLKHMNKIQSNVSGMK